MQALPRVAHGGRSGGTCGGTVTGGSATATPRTGTGTEGAWYPAGERPSRSKSRSGACSNDESCERKTWRPFWYSTALSNLLRFFGRTGPSSDDLAWAGIGTP